MLVLSRKVGERIQAGSVWVEVVEIRGNSVRLGLVAPDDVTILREELVPAADSEPLDLVEV
jgi:carbon storage regulator